MKNILSLLTAFVLLTGALLISGDTKKVSAQTVDLVSQLPAADAVAIINLKKVINEVMPQILASQPAQLAEINAKINDFKAQTGVDLRQFEQVAMAVNIKPGRAGATEAETLFLMRGNFTAAGLLAAGKIAVNGKFRQETIAGKNITIFAFPESVKKTTKQSAKTGSATADGVLDKTMSGELAFYVVDANTIAAGKLTDVRSMLTKNVANNRVSPNLIELVNRNSNAVMSFAGNVPADLPAASGLGNDQIGKIVKSLQQMFGSVDMINGAVSLNLAAKTAEEPQAQELESTLLGLQMLGKGMIGSQPDEKNQVLSRVIENLKITRSLTEVQLQATLSQSDLGKLTVDIK